ncbi:mitosis inhibitor protein kinase swe1 [Coemansia sp. RSA 2440]|nr:mitosis inhibitor protein kinase swe1 [Coemansia sp. RSA 2440]
MTDTPRVIKRGLRKSGTAQGVETPGGQRRGHPVLRTCVSFPALAEPRDEVGTPTPGARASGLLEQLTPGACQSPCERRGLLSRLTPVRQASGFDEQSQSDHSSKGGSRTPTRTPFPGRAQRRLTFTPALFTPPATKLVRPDPRAFTSTGLQSKKQARTRAPESAWRATPSRTPDATRLGKHRVSTDSLRRTRKKAHVGPEETPVRSRRDTLVDERPPALRLSGLPPAFAPQHAQLLQSLDDGAWGDEASESSAATLTVSPDAARATRFEPRDAMDVDASSSSNAASDDDDVFGRIDTHERPHSDDVFGRAQSDDVFGRIDAHERPQMPQIMQGCATNYAHFVGRDYFSGPGRPFLAPSDEFCVDGLGYLDYYEQQFEELGRAGEGDFATVASVRSLDDGAMYAVKRTRRPYAGRAERTRRLREPELLWAVPPSASIVRLVSAWEQFGHLFLQFELCERGSLAAYLDSRAATAQPAYMSEPRAWAVLAHAAHAVGLLHAQGIVHLDIKPANFLLGAEFDDVAAARRAGWLKLADFGHAVRLPRDPLAWVEEGDRQYMAPEVLRGEYAPAADVFSLGLMLLEIVADIVLPENGADWHKLRTACFDDPCFEGLPYAPPLLSLIKRMLHPDPAARPTLPQVLSLCHVQPVSAAPTPLVSDAEDDDTGFVRLQRHHSYTHHSGFVRPSRPLLLRAATAGSAEALQSSSAHPMVTRSAAKATDPTPTGLARRTASAI